MISISRISKEIRKKRLLHDISLEIFPGEIFGLLGANGAGKSTLISILATVNEPTTGSFSVNGFEMKGNATKLKEAIGYVPQEIALWEDLTVKENLQLWSKFAKTRIEEERMRELCSAVELHKWNEKVAHLSGGMKRKLNIAVALLHDPKVLLMDEPTVGIDLKSKLEINQYVKELAAQGKTIVYITHDLNEIIHLCDRIAVLRGGELVFTGTLDQAKTMQLGGCHTEMSMEMVVYELLK